MKSSRRQYCLVPSLLRPRRLRPDIAVFVFSVPEQDLDRFSVAKGPGVAGDHGNSLLDPRMQDVGETPRLTASLFTALTGRDATSALIRLDRVGGSLLSRCSDDFVMAMADNCEESLRLAEDDEARGDENLTSFMKHQEVTSLAWMRAGRWPREVVGLENRLTRVGWAREARETSQHVYTWHGPAVETYRIVSGSGPYPGRP